MGTSRVTRSAVSIDSPAVYVKEVPLRAVIAVAGTLASLGCMSAGTTDKNVADAGVVEVTEPLIEIDSIPWMFRQAIREIQTIQQSIEQAIRSGVYDTRSSSLDCDWGSLSRTLSTDGRDVPRRYRVEGGSDDRAGEVSYYYDSAGQLRFTFESFRPVAGTHRETRVYFDASGQEIHRDVRLLAGEATLRGYDLVQKDPWLSFRLGCA